MIGKCKITVLLQIGPRRFGWTNMWVPQYEGGWVRYPQSGRLGM